MQIHCTRLHPSARTPVISTSGSAGYDISICDDYEHIKMKEALDTNPRLLKEYPNCIPIQYIGHPENFSGEKIAEKDYFRTVFYVDPGKTVLIHTGLIIEIPKNHVGLLVARSGISNHYGITPKDCIGIIDSDYRGELLIHLVNHSNEPYYFAPYERVCQLIITPYITGEIVFDDAPSQTSRGTNGFGSSGSN